MNYASGKSKILLRSTGATGISTAKNGITVGGSKDSSKPVTKIEILGGDKPSSSGSGGKPRSGGSGDPVTKIEILDGDSGSSSRFSRASHATESHPTSGSYTPVDGAHTDSPPSRWVYPGDRSSSSADATPTPYTTPLPHPTDAPSGSYGGTPSGMPHGAEEIPATHTSPQPSDASPPSSTNSLSPSPSGDVATGNSSTSHENPTAGHNEGSSANTANHGSADIGHNNATSTNAENHTNSRTQSQEDSFMLAPAVGVAVGFSVLFLLERYGKKI